ncbi:GTP 3',8-cyclase MoaA [Stackebrandtia nassauensis]|uniref:GTP 3',8-cyclase n=1 Tax=Stackebrandtia nassauensis (strain DSM 44728 / CIP 108903 / NRRL B-16338 / NBRC 102104 / LLR-40K-21) TaxID=446470 RepID=D3PUF4_STANL|nr:GTP 3',8-cyclase MoaA [Stackebrandtia nassauensis]ADD42967.1 molybdenum cofactor biosynthesis protein A [Stackebrandtia nassauensis DSM 44728]
MATSDPLPTTVTDALGRPMGSLRVSVTDRCNLRCRYCMPEEEYAWLSSTDILSFDELTTVASAFTELGVDKIRLTGGEPLLRPGLDELIGKLATDERITDIALTTNGILLSGKASGLREAGLGRVTVSLDTLDAARFRELSRRGTHDAALAGIATAAEVFGSLKIDTVVMRGFNDDELVDLIEYGKTVSAEVRFIEYMDVGGATGWTEQQVYSRARIIEDLTAHYGHVTPLAKHDTAPADQFALPDGTVFGIISSTTQPFCGACDRSRLTADGMWLRCLYARTGTDLRGPLRRGADRDELAALIADIWRRRRDQGAVHRLDDDSRTVFVGLENLKRDPHLEMHTRGG